MTNGGTGNRRKRTALVLIGAAVGLFFFYLAFRDISPAELLDGLIRMKPIYLIPATLGLVLIQLVRAYRFGLIVRPFCKVGLKDLWDISNIWGALNMVMPARLAEFVRPYLLQQLGASFSSGFGAVMVERFFDLLGLLTLLSLILWRTPQIPAVYAFMGKVLLVGLASGYVVVLLILSHREKVDRLIDRVMGWAPSAAMTFVAGVIRKLIDGLGIMASGKQAFIIFVCSLTIWTLFSGVTYLFLLAFSIEASFLVAITIQVFLCFGVALPSAPGFIGTFHAAGRYALAIFGVAAIPAVSFATVYHCFSLVGSVLLGIISYGTGRFTFDRGLTELYQVNTPDSDTALKPNERGPNTASA